MHHAGGDDGQVIPVAVAAVILAGVVALPGLTGHAPQRDGRPALGAAVVLAVEPRLRADAQLVLGLVADLGADARLADEVQALAVAAVVAPRARVPRLDEPPDDGVALVARLLHTFTLLLVESVLQEHAEVGLLLVGVLELLELEPQVNEPDHSVLLLL